MLLQALKKHIPYSFPGQVQHYKERSIHIGIELHHQFFQGTYAPGRSANNYNKFWFLFHPYFPHLCTIAVPVNILKRNTKL
jgi:hypothetical protein